MSDITLVGLPSGWPGGLNAAITFVRHVAAGGSKRLRIDGVLPTILISMTIAMRNAPAIIIDVRITMRGASLRSSSTR